MLELGLSVATIANLHLEEAFAFRQGFTQLFFSLNIPEDFSRLLSKRSTFRLLLGLGNNDGRSVFVRHNSGL